MDTISSLVLGHTAGKLIDRIAVSFRTQVVERWSKRRAHAYFEEFCGQVALELSGTRAHSLDKLLTKMLEDEISSEVLFDGYRRVVLSRSKKLGPKIIGILTAQLVIGQRDPTEAEEAIMDASEKLSDKELLEFAKFVNEQRKRANS